MKPHVLTTSLYIAFATILITMSLYLENVGWVINIAFLPWSVINMFYESAILFLALPAFLVNVIVIYILSRKFFSNDSSDGLLSSLTFLLPVGYLIWSAPIYYYATTCTAKLCNIMIIMSLNITLFVWDLLSINGNFDDLFSLITILLNAVIIFLIGKLVQRFLVRK